MKTERALNCVNLHFTPSVVCLDLEDFSLEDFSFFKSRAQRQALIKMVVETKCVGVDLFSRLKGIIQNTFNSF